jgi:hypothetical protein
MEPDIFDAFVKGSRSEQDRLHKELLCYDAPVPRVKRRTATRYNRRAYRSNQRRYRPYRAIH